MQSFTGTIGMNKLKQAIYESILGCLVDDSGSNWGHMKAFLFANPTRTEYLGVSIDHFLQIHFNSVSFTNDPSTEYEVPALGTGDRQKVIDAMTELSKKEGARDQYQYIYLELEKNYLATATSKLETAKNDLQAAKDKVAAADEAVKKAQEAYTAAQETTAAKAEALTKAQDLATKAETALNAAKAETATAQTR